MFLANVCKLFFFCNIYWNTKHWQSNPPQNLYRHRPQIIWYMFFIPIFFESKTCKFCILGIKKKEKTHIFEQIERLLFKKYNAINQHLIKITIKKIEIKLVDWNKISTFANDFETVGVAQLVRVPDCGSEGRGFESHLPPKKVKENFSEKLLLYSYI